MIRVTRSCFRGMSREYSAFYNRLAEMIVEKRIESVEKIKSWMRCRLNFQLVEKPTIMYTWFQLGKKMFKNEDEDANLVVSKSRN